MKWYNQIIAIIVASLIVMAFSPLRIFIKWEELMDEIRNKAEEER